MLRASFASLALALATAAVGCAGTEPEGSSIASQDLIGGSTAGAKYEAVGALVEGDAATPFCTATLVSPTLIITAKHCIEGGGEEDPHPKDPKTVSFFYGDTVKAASGSVTLKRWIEAPDFAHPEYANYASDVTLAELDTPLAIPFIPVSKSALTDAELGHAFDVVGFGVRSEDGFGEAEGLREVGSFNLQATSGNAHEKRFGTRAKFDEYFAKLDPAASEDGMSDRFWSYGQLHAQYEVLVLSDKSETCYSDSGGPLLRPLPNGNLEVVGVVSEGFPGYASSCLHLGTVFAVFGPKTAAFLSSNGL